MRILYVTQVRLDHPSGGARHVIACVRELAALDHEVTLFAPGHAELGPTIHRRPRQSRPGLRLEAELAAMVGNEILRARPDVAYVRLSATSSAVPAVLRAAAVPTAFELNGRILDELEARGKSGLAVDWVRRSLTWAISGGTVVAPQAVIAAHAVESLGALRVQVVPNGANLAIAVPGDRMAARQRLGVPQEARFVALCGSLGPELRVDLLAAALDRLPDVWLLIAGEGARRGEVEQWARRSSRVRWFGHVPHPKAIEILQAGDVLVDLREGWLGMKAIEHAAIGRRQMVFETDGVDRIRSLYPNLDAVHVATAATPDAVYAAIVAALEAEARLGPLPARTVREARRSLGWDHTAAQLAMIMGELVHAQA